MSNFWKVVNFLNDTLVSFLTPCEDSEDCTEERDLEQEWLRYLSYCSDDQLDRYSDKYGLYRSVKDDGRYKCEHVIAEYCASRGYETYYI